jgi:hypothetical protein
MIVIGVSRRYQNCQKRMRKYGKTHAKPVWYLYYRDDNDDFRTKRISLLEVPIYKSQIRRKRTLICDTCENEFEAYVKSDTEERPCPKCDL